MPTSALFSSMTLRSLTFRNRLWVAPMCQYAVEEKDGTPTPWHLVHLGSQARGGAGLVFCEATAVVPEGRISAWDTGIWNDEQRDAWAGIVDFIHSQGAHAGVQLAHAGRKASTYRDGAGTGTMPESEGGWQAVAPSAVAFDGYDTPRELSVEEISQIVASFGVAAQRSLDAGFDVLEVHAAHGYLLHEFLSPLSNKRTDEYGGTLENRARIVLDSIREVRRVAGEDVPVFVRFSATDWVEGGWTVEETATVAAWAKEAGADLADISSGGLTADAKITAGPGYQVPFAKQVREAGIPVSAVGLITDAAQAEEIVASGQADAVMSGREFLRDPHFALRAAHELGVEVEWPTPYVRGKWHR
ncbi:NADH:flavin oxidoreductase/NADH oxidase [Demequina aurantiaca]|uniref:NADH:flavin oxidoreductase/NADH oxidase n=1 Tax=Demequina aurantiaca TaxID=676200 RepID=UPI0007807FBD|nr:NADH:flavin oxidoreductase/NADH oxidase [Demequina aurantiaca]